MSDQSEPGLDTASQPPKHNQGSGMWVIVLTLCGIGGLLACLFLPAVNRGRELPRRTQCKNNLRQLSLALYNYHKDFGGFPPAYTVDADGTPLHSWRTLILPYLDQAPLYNRIDLSKPWDDPANAEPCNTDLPVFRCPSANCPNNQTTYLAVVGADNCFHPTKPRPIREITDGTSNTLMVIDVPTDRSVPWMSPQDADEALFMSIGPESKLAHEGGFHTALCDGSVRFLSDKTPAAVRRALITIAAGDEVGDF